VVLDKLVYPAAEHATDPFILLDVKELVFSSRTAKVSSNDAYLSGCRAESNSFID
jgi:hypothetical protein